MSDVLFLTIVIGAGVLRLVLHKQIQKKLAYRITAMIFAVSIIMILSVVLIARIFFGAGFPPDSTSPPPPGSFVIFFSAPFLIGAFASWFVNRPLKQFTTALRLLEEKHYTKLPLSGIQEFDEAFTDLNRLTTRLQREEELRKDLISDTSHELNTPLAAILGQLVAMQDGTLPITKERISSTREQTERLINLVQQLDTYTKARVPHTRQKKLIELRSECQIAFMSLRELIKRHDVQIELKIDEDLRTKADPEALQQILVNLIQNTLRHANATKITIAANKNGLTYYDNGKGVSADHLQHLFERFYRVETSRNRKTGGLGLGLAIVAELADQQGWQIHAEATHPGLAIVVQFRH